MVSHQMPAHVGFTISYDISRVLTLCCFLSIGIPILNIIYNLCFKFDSSKSIQAHKFLQSKIILFLSMSSYIIYLTLIAFETIAQYTHLDLNIFFCKAMFSKFSLFILAKVFLFNYFILRANDTFYGTAYQFNACFIQSILPVELLLVFCIIFPIQYWIIPHSHIDIIATPINDGQLCILHFSQNISYYGLYLLLCVGGITEIIFACIGLSLLFYKLIIVITSTTNDSDIYYNPALTPQRDMTSNSKSLLAQNVNVSINHSTTTTTSKESNTVNTKKIADKIIVFHDNTANINRSLLLITKLLCLLLVQIVFIVLAVVTYFTTEMRLGYTLNAVCDIYCLWLTFKFSERYYYEFCLGSLCTKMCFPFVKTLALSVRCLCCDVFCDHEQKFDKKIFKAKHRIICCLCCCSRYFSIKKSKKTKILKMTKAEVELLLATKLDHKPRDDYDVWN